MRNAPLSRLLTLSLLWLTAVLAACTAQPAEAPQPTEADPSAQITPVDGVAIVATDTAVLRAQPDVTADVVATLQRDDVVILLARTADGNFREVIHTGSTSRGWIGSQFLAFVTPTPTGEATAVAELPDATATNTPSAPPAVTDTSTPGPPVPTDTSTPGPPDPTDTSTPGPPDPTDTSTPGPPPPPLAQINQITIANGRYIVEYETFGFTETLSGQHVHFFFNTVTPQNAGYPGSGPWKLYGGPRPFTDYLVSDRPAAATQMCILVANADHSVQLNTGNCVDLP